MKDISKTSIESKAQQRRRGALSCAECRRLKLRCDRVFPCQSCKKRGCAAICPDGALTTGKGNRFILANTEELHDRIEALQERITQLELGLGSLHAQSNAQEVHPLLTDDLLNIKTPIGAEIVGTANPRNIQRNREREQKERDAALGDLADDDGSGAVKEEEEEEIADSFGTLKLGEGSAQSQFFGIAAGAHWLLGGGQSDESDEEARPNDQPDAAHDGRSNGVGSNGSSSSPGMAHKSPSSSNGTTLPLSPQMAHMARSYPFSILGKDWPAARDQLRAFLPEPHHAWSLSEQYFEHAAWLYNPFTRLFYVENIFTPIMDPNYVPDPTDPKKPEPSPADYALLFMVLALGSVFNLTVAPYGPDCEKYHTLARAALGSEEPMPDSLTGVQALLLMCFYNQVCGEKEGAARAWSVSGLAYKMAFAIGLHRDGSRWNLEVEETDRRRTVFWELAMFDAWSAQGLGRPYSMFNPQVDVEFPNETPTHFDSDGKPEQTFARNKLLYAQTVIEIYDQAFGAKRPTYDVILRLDRKIRDLSVPLSLQVHGINTNPNGPHPAQPTTRAQVMQAHTNLCIKEGLLVYLHRGWLARALAEHPDDPFKSRFAASVLAAHRSSCAILSGVRNALYLLPRLMPRVFFLWIHAFSAAMVLATIVIRCPSSNLTTSSLRELDLACDMFERAKEGYRAASLLPTLLKLRTRAHSTYEEWRQGKPRFLSPPIDAVGDSRAEDDLTMLGSTSRLVRVKDKSRTTPSGSSPQSHDGDGSSSMEESPRPAASDYHPTLAEYLKAYDQQLDHQRALRVAAGRSTSPDAYRAEVVAGAVAQITGEPVTALPSVNSTPSSVTAPSLSSGSSGPGSSYGGGGTLTNLEAFDYAYLSGEKQLLTVQTQPMETIAAYQMQQQQYVPEQPSTVYGGQTLYSPHQSPLSAVEPGSAYHSPSIHQSPHALHHSPHAHHQSPHTLHQSPHALPQHFTHQSPHDPAHAMQLPPVTQYYAEPLHNPNTPFSAFEPAFIGGKPTPGATPSSLPGTHALHPSHSQQPNFAQTPNYGVGLNPGLSPQQPRMGFPPLDMGSLGQAPEGVDMGWQFMTDLRPYM